jgi:hypothetical protein
MAGVLVGWFKNGLGGIEMSEVRREIRQLGTCLISEDNLQLRLFLRNGGIQVCAASQLFEVDQPRRARSQNDLG